LISNIFNNFVKSPDEAQQFIWTFFKFVRVKSFACPLKYDTQAAEPFFEGFGVSMPFLIVFRRILIWKDGANRKSKIEI
jgi:hypothetical protein